MNHIYYVIFLVLIFMGCDVLNSGKDNDDQNLSEKNINSESEIIFGKGVHDVQLGDSVSSVENFYGKPWRIGKGHGLRGWSIWSYRSGELAGVTLRIHQEMKVVDYIFINRYYSTEKDTMKKFSGSNNDNIGIGTSVNTLLTKMGPPDYSPYDEGPHYKWYYCVEGVESKNELYFSISQDSIRAIGMGYHIPFENKEDKDCNFGTGGVRR